MTIGNEPAGVGAPFVWRPFCRGVDPGVPSMLVENGRPSIAENHRTDPAFVSQRRQPIEKFSEIESW